jgi:hypothetical protein
MYINIFDVFQEAMTEELFCGSNVPKPYNKNINNG